MTTTGQVATAWSASCATCAYFEQSPSSGQRGLCNYTLPPWLMDAVASVTIAGALIDCTVDASDWCSAHKRI